MNLSPIALFVYNRLDHTKKTIEALQKNVLACDSELFIFSDGPKNIEERETIENVRKYLKTINGFKKIEIREKSINFGLAGSIIEGVTEIVNLYNKIIVLEDDLVTSPYFLTFMNKALDFYEKEEKVISIHGYINPISKTLPETFFLKNPGCWGWATWKRGWNIFEPNGSKLLNELEKNKRTREFDFNNSYKFSETLRRQAQGLKDSWAIRWYASAFLSDKLTLYPGVSLIQNIGFDGSGVHSGKSNYYEIKELSDYISIKNIPIVENIDARHELTKYYNSIKANIPKRIMWKLSSLINFIFKKNNSTLI